MHAARRVLVIASLLAATSAAAEERLWFDARELYTRPMVRANLAGRSLMFLLDSGSPRHVCSLDQARALDLFRRPHEPIYDYAYRRHVTYSLPNDAAALGDLGAVLPLLASDWTDALDDHLPGEPHFDGVFSPQNLPADNQALIMDFVHGTLAQAPWPEAERLVRQQPKALADVRAEDGVFTVAATVAQRPLRLLIDTGAPITDLFRAPDVELPRGAVRRSWRNARVAVGAVARSERLRVTMAHAYEGAMPYDGVLGMDVMRNCVLAIDRERLLAACSATPDSGPQPLLVPTMVQLTDRGPWLEERDRGRYRYHGRTCEADIDADGALTFESLPPTDETLTMRSEDEERNWLAEMTRTLRVSASFSRSLAMSFAQLPTHLQRVWAHRRWSPARRRAILFALWNETADAADPERAAAGARARRMIETFVRRVLPNHSKQAFSDGELARLNATRLQPSPFSPYSVDPRDDRADDE